MKNRYIRLIAIFAIIIAVSFSLCSCSISNSRNYDKDIISDASNCSSYYWLTNIRPDVFEVTRIDDTTFNVRIDGNRFEFKTLSYAKHVPTVEEGSVDSGLIKIIDQAKSKVKKYVRTSTVLVDKDTLCQKIDELPVFFSNDSQMVEYSNGKLLINKSKISNVSLTWNATHEVLRYLTSITRKDSPSMICLVLDYTLTDLITDSIKPAFGYRLAKSDTELYAYIYPLIRIYKEDVFKAYFYGFDSLAETMGENYFIVFSTALDSLYTNSESRRQNALRIIYSTYGMLK